MFHSLEYDCAVIGWNFGGDHRRPIAERKAVNAPIRAQVCTIDVRGHPKAEDTASATPVACPARLSQRALRVHLPGLLNVGVNHSALSH
jgi:hypothetical protein